MYVCVGGEEGVDASRGSYEFGWTISIVCTLHSVQPNTV